MHFIRLKESGGRGRVFQVKLAAVTGWWQVDQMLYVQIQSEIIGLVDKQGTAFAAIDCAMQVSFNALSYRGPLDVTDHVRRLLEMRLDGEDLATFGARLRDKLAGYPETLRTHGFRAPTYEGFTSALEEEAFKRKLEEAAAGRPPIDPGAVLAGTLVRHPAEPLIDEVPAEIMARPGTTMREAIAEVAPDRPLPRAQPHRDFD